MCQALGLIVTSNYEDSTISAHALMGPDHRLLGTWGGTGPGPLQFDFGGRHSGASGGLCFTIPVPAAWGGGGLGMAGAGAGGAAAATISAVPQLLVASHGTQRVVVLDMGGVCGGGGAPEPAGAFGGACPDDPAAPAPRSVAACVGLVAVSGWTRYAGGDHAVTLYTAGTWARVRVVGLGIGRGAGDGQLDRPYGLRFSADGARLLVADYGNHRVCCFRVSDGAFAGVVTSKCAHGLSGPRDVVVVAGGVLVADYFNHRVVRVPMDGSPTIALGGVEGSELGQLSQPAALFVSTDGAQIIVREAGGGRLQVFMV